MKKILKLIALCAIVGITDLLLFALLLRTPLFNNMHIYYYRALALAVFSAVIPILGLILYQFMSQKHLQKNQVKATPSPADSNIVTVSTCQKTIQRNLEPVEIFSCAAICSLCMLLLVSVASMPLDRSYTIYSLVDMADHPEQVYTREEIENQFIEGYINKMDATQRRIEEQVSIGNLQQVDGGYQITEKGQRQVQIFRFYEKIFPTSEKRILYPEA